MSDNIKIPLFPQRHLIPCTLAEQELKEMVATFIENSTWHGVSDPKKRKQIQDRLAQRARRKRLALARSSVSESSSSEASSPSSSGISCADSDLALQPARPAKFPSNGTAFCLVPAVSNIEGRVNEIPISVFAALFNNGAMLGLACGCLIPAKSQPCGESIPEALHPTPLQLTTLHQTWIDRFPFPKMRDNMINLNRIFDEEDFLCDLFNMHSFDIKPGGACSDPSAWVIGKEFAKKWGFLFY